MEKIMIRLLRRLWSDDGGALISTEWLCLSSLAVLGVVAGASMDRNAVNAEFADQALSLKAMSQTYRVPSLQPLVSHGQAAANRETIVTPELLPSF